MSVLLGVGDGTFTLKSSPATGTSPRSVTSADFNGDGKADLATANYNPSTVSVLLGAGDGTFTLKSSPATGANPVSVTSADFNGGGKADLATANSGASTVGVLLGVGDGTFTFKSAPATGGASPYSVTSGDFNGDGKPDLVTANPGTSIVSVLLGVGDGTFTLKSSPATGTSPRSVTSADFNGDGKADFATANQTANTVSVLLGVGDGTFTLKSTPATGAGPDAITIGDFNGDGKADLATANNGDNTVSVLLGVGDGTFTAQSSPVTGAYPVSVTSADFNGDGKRDLATANFSANTVSVLLNNPTPPPTVTTGVASAITATSVTLNGTVNPDGGATTAQFQYSTDTSYNLTATVTLAPTNGTTAQTVSAAISGLTPGTLYHFRLSATNSNGTTNGADATFTTLSALAVTTTSDVVSSSDGVTSLREAITYANTHAGADTITFALPGTGVQTIQLGAVLPTLTDIGTTIDGTTQSGASANTLATGSNAVLLVQIRGNSTSTDDGFFITASNCVIRGLAITNCRYGVAIQGTSASGNTVSGNFIGTNAAGTAAIANATGVFINGAPGNTIGGTPPAERNLISGNINSGVYIGGASASGNKVSGNTLGTIADGSAALANGYGVLIDSAPGNTIGGTSAGERNLISGNTYSGIYIGGASATGNSVRGNSITANGTTASNLGIDLVGTVGVDANDAGDTDSGPNGLQNFPVLLSSSSRSGSTVIQGTLNSTPSTTFTLDFYSNGSASASGNGEGQTFLGSAMATTSAAGDASFTATFTGVSVASGAFISATATAPDGSTSEFCVDISNNLQNNTALTNGVFISELRLSGPGGARDEYIELANVTGSPIDLTGYTLSAGTVTSALSAINFTGKTLPAYGHLLVTNSGGYSLGTVYPSTYPVGTTTPSAYTTGDVQYTGDIALTSTITLTDSGGITVDTVGNLSGTTGFVSTNQYAFVRRQDGAILVNSGVNSNDFNLVDIASLNGPPTSDGISTLANGARLGTPSPQNSAGPVNRAALTLVPISIPGTIPEGRYVTKNSPVDPLGRLSLRRTITNNTSQTITQIRFTLVRTTSGTNTDTSIADLRALSSTGVLNAQGVRVVQGIQIEAPTTPVGLSASLSPATTGNGGGLNASWNVGSLPAGGLAPGASMNVEFLFGIVRDGNYSTSVVATVAP